MVARIHWRGVLTNCSGQLHIAFDIEFRWTRTGWQEAHVSAWADGAGPGTRCSIVGAVEGNVFGHCAHFLGRATFHIKIYCVWRDVLSTLSGASLLLTQFGCWRDAGWVDDECIADESVKRERSWHVSRAVCWNYITPISIRRWFLSAT